MGWLNNGSDGKNPHTKEAVDPIVLDGIKTLQGEYGVTKLGAVGYCFGAKVRRVPSTRRAGFRSNMEVYSTFAGTLTTASRLATSPTRPSLRRTSSGASRAPSPSRPPRRTASSPPRSATGPRRSSRRVASRTRSTCFRASCTGLPSAATRARRWRSLPRSRRSSRPSTGLTSIYCETNGGCLGKCPCRFTMLLLQPLPLKGYQLPYACVSFLAVCFHCA